MLPAVRQIITSVRPEIPSSVRASLLSYHVGSKRGGVYYPLNQSGDNGSFENNLTGWSTTGVNGTVSTANFLDGAKSVILNITANNGHKYKDILFPNGDKILLRCAIYLSSYTSGGSVIGVAGWDYGIFSNAVIGSVNVSLLNQWQFVNVIKTATNTGVRISVGAVGVTTATFYVDCVETIDLSVPIGSGNEPTATEMDAILLADGTPYWDGTRNVLCNPNGKYYLFDASNNNRTIKGYNFAYTTASGWNGNQLVIDGTDDYLRRVMATAQADGTSYSYMATLKCAVIKVPVYLHTGATIAMIIGLDANGYAYVTTYDTANNAYTVTDNTSKANTLTQIVAVVDIAAMKLSLYVNGVSRGAPATLANTVRGFSTYSLGTNAATNAYVALTLLQLGLINKAVSGYEAKQLYDGYKRYIT